MPRRQKFPEVRISPAQKMAEVIYLVDRLPKNLYPNRLAEFGKAAAEPGAVVIPVAFGAVTRTERMRERRAGWGSEAIERVRQEDERRGSRNRK